MQCKWPGCKGMDKDSSYMDLSSLAHPDTVDAIVCGVHNALLTMIRHDNLDLSDVIAYLELQITRWKESL